jgi:hypothetical protein
MIIDPRKVEALVLAGYEGLERQQPGSIALITGSMVQDCEWFCQQYPERELRLRHPFPWEWGAAAVVVARTEPLPNYLRIWAPDLGPFVSSLGDDEILAAVERSKPCGEYLFATTDWPAHRMRVAMAGAQGSLAAPRAQRPLPGSYAMSARRARLL